MKTKYVFRIMEVVSWIIFIGLCIKAGALIVSFSVSLFVNPEAAQDLYLNLDLSSLNAFNHFHYIAIVSFILAIWLLKAYIFYLVIKVFLILSLEKPFDIRVTNLVSKIGYFAFSMGIVALIAESYSKDIMKRGAVFQFNWGASEYLFMAGLIYIVAVLFKRGIALQTENELTI